MARRKIRIPVWEFVDDIRMGMDRNNLMVKYNLNEKTLNKVLDKMVGRGYLHRAQLMFKDAFESTISISQLFQALDDLEEQEVRTATQEIDL